MKKLIHVSFVTFVCIVLIGCAEQAESTSNSLTNAESSLFAQGIWVHKTELDALKSGRISGDFQWDFDQYTSRSWTGENGKVYIESGYDQGQEVVLPCEKGWCQEDRLVARFGNDEKDTIAFFSNDPIGKDAAFSRVTPPDLSVNDYPDWVFRKYYFAGSYECKNDRGDSTFTIEFDQDGRVIGSDRWEKYNFHSEHDYPVLFFHGPDGERYPYMFTTYSGVQNSFSLHEVLNSETLFDGADGEVEIGDRVYMVDGK